MERPRNVPRCVAALAAAAALAAQDATAPTLQETRLTLEKWHETQQIVARERKDWQQGKEVLVARIELLQKEVATLEQKIAQGQAAVAKAESKRAELVAENEQLQATAKVLADAVGGFEQQVRELLPVLPPPVLERAQPIVQRMPAAGAATRVSVAERYQNVLGLLGELNRANQELTVAYEVHSLAGGRRAEVQVLYVGLAQAYSVSARGEAGIGRPGPAGWHFQPAPALARPVLLALEILQGKHTPAFVPLPARLQ
jgi:septal ring factor EnvC (AmiA/AmiB activator)